MMIPPSDSSSADTPPSSSTVALIEERLAVVRERIRAAGGDPELTSVLAVTKVFPVEVARLGVDAGLLDLGENYAQELLSKAETLDRPTARWHMIGGLQRNKVRRLAGVVSVWQTVDRVELVAEIAKRDPGATIHVQVNTTDEDQKSGCSISDAPRLIDEARRAGLDVSGLMTVGPTGGRDPRPGFAALRSLAAAESIAGLSMGMSGDLEAAVAEGSTMVRVGTALFGPRRT